MRIAVYADRPRHTLLQEILQKLIKPDKKIHYLPFEHYDDFISELPASECHVTIVAMDGAGGMESARAAKILLPEVPLIWLSDDRGFGPESYRVGCSYFSAEPITEALLRTALERCDMFL